MRREHEERTVTVRGWLKEHDIKSIATFTSYNSDDKYQVIQFRVPDTYNYCLKFIINDGYLYVSGDIGVAVFKWQHVLTWEWLAGLDFSYMMEKCQAVKRGNKDGKEWIPEKAERWLRQYIGDRISDDMVNNGFTKVINGSSYDIDWDDLTVIAQNKLIDLEIANNNFECAGMDEHDFRQLLQNNNEYFVDYFEYGTIGEVYDVSMYAYWQALKLIGEKLKEREKTLIV